MESMLNPVVFKRHLDALLPMQNPTWEVDNPVQLYCLEVLHKIGRTPVYDPHGNILAETGFDRAIVAHTDSVMQRQGKVREAVSFKGGVYRSKRNLRPIGGDDKVGVAVALTLAESNPTLSCLLFADEESGCVGSGRVSLQNAYYLVVQCDRKGTSDLVGDIYGQRIAHSALQREACRLLSHREVVDGGLTDVLTLVERGLAWNAFNLSAGYYKSHSVDEYVVLSHAWQACLDADTLLCYMPNDLGMAYDEQYLGRRGGPDRGLWGDWEEEEESWKGLLGDTAEDKTLVQRIEEGPFSADGGEWEEDGFGGYVNRDTLEVITSEEVQTYFEVLGQTTLDSAVGSR